jgi:hypothetical protein
LTSIATSASVWLMTIEPPDFSQTLLLSALSISGLHAVLVEDRERLRIELHLRREVRKDALHEFQPALVLLRMVDPDGLEVFGQQVAEEFPDQALLAIDDGRRPGGFHPLADVGPDGVERHRGR